MGHLARAPAGERGGIGQQVGGLSAQDVEKLEVA